VHFVGLALVNYSLYQFEEKRSIKIFLTSGVGRW